MCSLLDRHRPAPHRYQSSDADADESDAEDSTCIKKGHPRGTQDPYNRYAV